MTKNFRHAAVEIDKLKQNTPKRKGDYIRIRKWFGSAGDAACAGSLRGIISSMIVGVTEVSKHSSHTVSALVGIVCLILPILSFIEKIIT